MESPSAWTGGHGRVRIDCLKNKAPVLASPYAPDITVLFRAYSYC